MKALFFCFLSLIFLHDCFGQMDSLQYEVADSMRARELLKEGKQLIKAGKYSEALLKLDSSEIVWKKNYSDSAAIIAHVIHQKAFCNYYLGLYNETENLFNKVLKIRLKQVKNDHTDIGDLYNDIGALNIVKGNLSEAYFLFEKSLKIRLEHYGSNHKDVASSLNNLGVIDDMKGDYRNAILNYQRALKIWLNILGNDHENIADNYLNIATVYKARGSFDKAISYNDKALRILINVLGNNHPKIANLYENLGNIYEGKKELEKAFLFHSKALRLREKNFDNNHPSIANSYAELGANYNDRRDYVNALKSHQKALKIWKNKFKLNHYRIGEAYNAIGNVLMNLKDLESAKVFLEQGLEIRQENFGNFYPDIIQSYNNLGRFYLHKKQNDSAEEFYLKALKFNNLDENIFERVLSVEEGIETLKRLSSLYLISYYQKKQNLNLLTQAYKNSQKTLDFSKYLLSKGIDFSWKMEFISIYEQAIRINKDLASHDVNSLLKEEAFDYSEINKGTVLIQQIQESNALHFANLPDTLLQKEYDLRIDITYYDKKRQEKLNQDLEETDTTVLKISSKLFDLNQEYEALKKQFETDYPDYYKLKYDLSTVSLDYVQDTLLSQNQTLLEYFVGDSSLFLFVVKPDDYQVIEVKKDFPLEDWIKDLQQGISGAYGAEQYSDKLYGETLKKYIEVAPKLYEKLIAPVANLLTEEVILIPDGVLGYVPFEALLKTRPSKITNFNSYPFLVKDHRFSYCYSATLLREMMEKKHKKQPSKSLLAFAPFYEGSYEKLNELFGAELDTLALSLDLPGFEDVVTRKTFKKLPHSGEEVFAAKKIWEGDVFLNDTATEDKFNQISDDYRIVHLSTHGIADSRVGDYSYLAFAEQKDSIENEYLYVRDLYNLQLNADLVVLSACETATGELQRGEGIISLARAFAYAGAKSILTTLWVVDDATTKELTKEFYLQLKKGNRKDAALRKAKLKMLKKGKNKQKHPFFWAAMIPVGDMRPLK